MPTGVLEPVLGDPVDVSAAGRTLQSIALDIANIATRLRALASGNNEWSGAAANSARARSASVPPKLDKANASYAAAGSALSSYARSLADAQEQSRAAIAAAGRASADLDTARTAQAAAATRDAAAAASARTAGVSAPAPTAPRYEASIDDAAARLNRASAINDQAHEQLREAAKATAAALHEASRVGIRNASWLHRVTHAVSHWVSTTWAAALRDVAKAANVVSAVAGIAALVLAVAGVFFPPLEAAAAALETVSLVTAVVAGAADTALAVTGEGSWTAVGIDALTLAPAGLGKVVTKAAPLIRDSRVITPTSVVHASESGASGLISREPPLGRLAVHIPGRGTQTRRLNYRPKAMDPEWGLTEAHLDKHFFGSGPLSLSTVDPTGNAEIWLAHMQTLATRPPTVMRAGGVQEIMGRFERADGSGTFRMGIRISPKDDGSFDLVTVLTIQRKSRV